MTLTASALILVGAGCGQEQYAIPANQANGETALSYRPSNPADVQPQAQTQGDQAAADGDTGAASAASDKWPRPASPPGILKDEYLRGQQATISTAKGKIIFEFLDKEAPMTVSNFITLARSGYYDGLKFHRVEPGFVIQGGDPLGNGTGGPGYKFEDEPVSLNYDAGIVAMANSGPDTNGSQFFIVLEGQPGLPKNYTIFGRVTSGMDVVRRISVGDVMNSVVIGDK